MPVNSLHAEWLMNTGMWQRSPDVRTGESAVKGVGQAVLHPLIHYSVADLAGLHPLALVLLDRFFPSFATSAESLGRGHAG